MQDLGRHFFPLRLAVTVFLLVPSIYLPLPNRNYAAWWQRQRGARNWHVI